MYICSCLYTSVGMSLLCRTFFQITIWCKKIQDQNCVTHLKQPVPQTLRYYTCHAWLTASLKSPVTEQMEIDPFYNIEQMLPLGTILWHFTKRHLFSGCQILNDLLSEVFISMFLFICQVDYYMLIHVYPQHCFIYLRQRNLYLLMVIVKNLNVNLLMMSKIIYLYLGIKTIGS